MDPQILNIEQAAELLGVSIKTFNKVLHTEDLPARKIGREWKFSRAALIEWVGSGSSRQYYRDESNDDADEALAPAVRNSATLIPKPSKTRAGEADTHAAAQRQGVERSARRTKGWEIKDSLD